ncbi:hypothetical protein N7U66_12695 [Lacinutrix neustonica]|uniref:Uncharacterized protein n=1 Tax=Lacinutrix neustonica TaxID=2980107 RepID=A0A9E8MT80_9FLAO|nr:hypothetical protein [Lacinutrix neustonica]WAC01033.1 hypothetical protein N7U66_12695 [Lacinutrix neustonica]
MKTTQSNTDLHLDALDFISNELCQEFDNVFHSLDDAIVID